MMKAEERCRTLCADLGGSRVKLATVEDGRILVSEIFDVSPDGAKGTLALLADRARRLMAAHPGNWAGVGLALPGIVDEEARRVTSCNAKHAGIEAIDLAAWARSELGIGLKVINDARAALLGEINYGCARGEKDAVMMILGTGVGTSAVSNGRVERGVHGTAGILGGHFPIAFENGRACTCGGAGCVEAYVGTWALREMAGNPAYDYRRLEADCAKGEPKALRLFETVSAALGAGALALVHLYDAETVIFSGGVSHFAALLDAAEDYVRKRAWTPWGKVKFVRATDPEASVTLGLHALFAEDTIR